MIAFGLMTMVVSIGVSYAQIYRYAGGGVAAGAGSTIPTSVTTHVTGSNLTRNGTTNAIGTVCGYTTAGYNATNRYVWFSVKPDAGYQLNVTTLTARVRRLSTLLLKVGYSTDGGVTWTDGTEITPVLDCSSIPSQTINLTVTGGKELRIRFLGYGALTAAGTMDISNITLNGTVTCDASISASITPTSIRICDDANGSFSSEVTSNVVGTVLPSISHSWSKTSGTGDGTLSSPTTNSSVTLTGTTAGTMTVGYTASWDGGACSVSANNSNVTIVPLPVISSSSNSPVCEGSAIMLSASGGDNYNWSGPNFGSAEQNPTINNATAAMSGTYSITILATGECTASVTNAIPVLVKPLPIISFGSNSPVCTGNTIQVSAGGGSSYAWTGPSFTSSMSNPTRPSATTAMSGLYSVTVIASGDCPLTVTNTISVIVSPRNIIPTINSIRVNNQFPNARNIVYVTPGSNINFVVSAINTVSYSWRSSTGFTSSLQNPAINNANGSHTGQYVVVGQNGCTFFGARTVNVVVQSATRFAQKTTMEESIQMEVSPNPFQNISKVRVMLQEPSTLKLKVMRAGDGRILRVYNNDETSSEHEFEVDLGTNAAGMYLFVAESETKVLARKVIKHAN